MNITEFESVLGKKKMRLERRFQHHGYDVYIAEGYSSPDADERLPHFKTMYAYAQTPEKMVMGEFFTTPVVFPIVSKHDRLAQAEDRARQLMDVLKESGCLKQ